LVGGQSNTIFVGRTLNLNQVSFQGADPTDRKPKKGLFLGWMKLFLLFIIFTPVCIKSKQSGQALPARVHRFVFRVVVAIFGYFCQCSAKMSFFLKTHIVICTNNCNWCRHRHSFSIFFCKKIFSKS
jgi:hypothetical protein